MSRQKARYSDPDEVRKAKTRKINITLDEITAKLFKIAAFEKSLSISALANKVIDESNNKSSFSKEVQEIISVYQSFIFVNPDIKDRYERNCRVGKGLVSILVREDRYQVITEYETKIASLLVGKILTNYVYQWVFTERFPGRFDVKFCTPIAMQQSILLGVIEWAKSYPLA